MIAWLTESSLKGFSRALPFRVMIMNSFWVEDILCFSHFAIVWIGSVAFGVCSHHCGFRKQGFGILGVAGWAEEWEPNFLITREPCNYLLNLCSLYYCTVWGGDVKGKLKLDSITCWCRMWRWIWLSLITACLAWPVMIFSNGWRYVSIFNCLSKLG